LEGDRFTEAEEGAVIFYREVEGGGRRGAGRGKGIKREARRVRMALRNFRIVKKNAWVVGD